MTEQTALLATFYKPGWETYQHALVQSIAHLSSEHLALSWITSALDQRTSRLSDRGALQLFHLWMGEGDPTLDWNDDQDHDEPPVYQAVELFALFEKAGR